MEEEFPFDTSGDRIKKSRFPNYLFDFYRLNKGTDKGGPLFQFLENIVYTENPVIIDLMASTDALESFQNTLLDNKPMKGLAVGYEEDQRSQEQKDHDQKIGIDYLKTDLNDPEAISKIKHWLNGQKARLTMERAFGGLENVDIMEKLPHIWDWTDPDGGMIILQTPPADALQEKGIPIRQWIQELGKQNIRHEFIESYVSRDMGQSYGLLLLQRSPESLQLPSLNTLSK